MEQQSDQSVDRVIGGPSDSGRIRVITADDVGRTILTSSVMMTAYAVSVIVLAIGLVIFSIALLVLCFAYPDKANALWLVLGSGILGLLVAHAKKAVSILGVQKDKSE